MGQLKTRNCTIFFSDVEDGQFRANRARFVNKRPKPPDKPTAAWINPPQTKLMVQA